MFCAKLITSVYKAADVLFQSLQGNVNYSRCGVTKGSLKDVYTDYFVGEVKTYRPDLLRELRHHFGISEALYKQCMNTQFLECKERHWLFVSL